MKMLECFYASMKYFVYCRKSTESEDRQALSIASQRDEIQRAFGQREDIHIVEVLEESRSAKTPGRPVFETMMGRIEKGEAQGIISWHPDRLARNSVDGGRIIYLLDQGCLRDLKFSTFTFENNSQGKLMLSITFGYSKYYVDNLSENVKRGNRAKVERGWRPGNVPLGYTNDQKTRTVIPDPGHFAAIQKLFTLVLSEQYSVRSIIRILTEEDGYRTPPKGRYGGGPLTKPTVYNLLGNPFYAGYFYWNDELHPGKHPAMITMSEFQRIQSYLGRKGTEKPQRHYFPFTGLIRCGACGLMVTAEHKWNRYGTHYVYYHCTRRTGTPRCRQPSIESGALSEQFLGFLELVLPDSERGLELATEVQAQKSIASPSTATLRAVIEQQLNRHKSRLTNLDDMRIDGQLTEEDYLNRKRIIQRDIEATTEQLAKQADLENWFEPARLLVLFATQAKYWFIHGKDEIKRAILSAVGSNYRLKDKKLLYEANEPFSLRVKEPASLYGWAFIDHFRTRFELSDPDILRVIEKVKAVKAMVESETGKEIPLELKNDEEITKTS